MSEKGSVIWKDISEYPSYKISQNGEVKSFKKYKEGIILKHYLTSDGYPRVGLYNHVGSRHFVIHRLVAEAFIPNPENLPQVNHINGIKTDNRVENLEWCTPSYNIQHSFDTGLKEKGESHPCSILTQLEVDHMRDLYKNNTYNSVELAELFMCSKSTVQNILTNTVWKDFNYKCDKIGLGDNIGKNHPMVKLTEKQVLEIREKYELGETSYRKLATEYNVDKSTIGLIVRKKLWKHI